MAALTQDVKVTRLGTGDGHDHVSFPIGANTTVFGGSIALTDASGNVKNAHSPASTDVCWGLIGNQISNSSSVALASNQAIGVDGQLFWIETGTFYLASGTGGDALTEAQVGQTVFVIDEVTVGKTNGGGTRPAAGVLVNVDASQPGGFAVKMGNNQSSGA